MVPGYPLSLLDPLSRLSATAALMNSSVAAMIGSRVEGAVRLTSIRRAEHKHLPLTSRLVPPRPHAPALIVAGGTTATRYAVATAYLLELARAGVTQPPRCTLLPAHGLELLEFFLNLDEQAPGGDWSAASHRWSRQHRESDAVALLEVQEGSDTLYRMADRYGDGPILVVTTPLSPWTTSSNSLIETTPLPEARAKFDLHPASPGFGFEPLVRLAPTDASSDGGGGQEPLTRSLFDAIDGGRWSGTAWRLRVASAGPVILAPDTLEWARASKATTFPAGASRGAAAVEMNFACPRRPTPGRRTSRPF